MFAIIGLCCLSTHPSSAIAQSHRPNILLIIADDLGYADVGVHGGCEVSTPNLDALAFSGVRCTQAYVTSPYCSPSRAGLLTGKYPTQFGHEFNPHDGVKDQLGMPLNQQTIANRLSQLGYATHAIGKWHQGFEGAYHPEARGFDSFFGFLVGGHNYILNSKAKPRFGTAHSHDMIYRGREIVMLDGFTTDLFTDAAIAAMRTENAKPWFIYLAYNAVHTPLEISEQTRSRIPDSVTDKDRRGYLSLLIGLDDAIGQIHKHLEATGQLDNTLIFFISDNGGAGKKPYLAYNTGRNAPLRGDKGQTVEGGIRVPFFVSWPSQIPKGKTIQSPVITLDILPTSLAATGSEIPDELQGIDLSPFLRNPDQSLPERNLYWRFGPQRAIRQGEWKAVDTYDFETKKSTGWQLFHLSEDISESNDLANSEPTRLAALTKQWEQWDSMNIAPLWRGSPTEDPREPANPK